MDGKTPGKLTSEEIGHFYDGAARTYRFWQPLKELAGLGKMRRRLLSRARGEVLEVAVGTGANLRHYPRDVRSGISITAVDISPRMLELAQQEARRLGMELTTRVMEAERLAYPDDSFDTVISAFSVCTFPNPVAALREMRRVCCPDGRVLLLGHGLSDQRPVATLQNLRARIWDAKRGCHGNRDTMALPTAAGLETMDIRRSRSGIFYELETSPKVD